MKLLLHERDQLSELLRCAADIAANERGARGHALGTAALRLDCISLPFLLPITGDSHWVSLLRGKGPVRDREAPEKWHICGEGYEWALLDAASRVDEGQWP